MLSGTSLFEAAAQRRTFQSSSFVGSSVIIVKSTYIPASFTLSDLLTFLHSQSHLYAAAVERLPKNHTIAIGFLYSDRVPELATALRCFLVRRGVRPLLHAARLSCTELESLLRTARVASVERYFSDPPDDEPEPPGADAETESLVSFGNWWAALDRPWHVAPVNVSIRVAKLEAGLELFQAAEIVDHPTEFRKISARMSNYMLQLPVVGPDVQVEIAAHRSFFEDERE
jgi:hypothetical protein